MFLVMFIYSRAGQNNGVASFERVLTMMVEDRESMSKRKESLFQLVVGAEVHEIRCTLSFDKQRKVSRGVINHLFVTVGLRFVFGLFYRCVSVALYVPLRYTIRKTLYGVYHLYFLPEMIV